MMGHSGGWRCQNTIFVTYLQAEVGIGRWRGRVVLANDQIKSLPSSFVNSTIDMSSNGAGHEHCA